MSELPEDLQKELDAWGDFAKRDYANRDDVQFQLAYLEWTMNFFAPIAKEYLQTHDMQKMLRQGATSPRGLCGAIKDIRVAVQHAWWETPAGQQLHGIIEGVLEEVEAKEKLDQERKDYEYNLEHVPANDPWAIKHRGMSFEDFKRDQASR
jgi:hypothetical protein